MRYVAKDVSTKRRGPDFKPFEVQVPQYDSLEEFVQAAGGNEQGLKFVNSATATGAVNGSRASCANAKKEQADDEVIAEARSVARNYTPTGSERGPGQKAKLAAMDDFLSRVKRGEDVSQEELLAMAAKFGA